MWESWILPLAIVAVFTALLAAPLVESLFSRRFRRKLVCPWVRSSATVEFVERVAFGAVAPPDVASCSHFSGPERPTCGKACLGDLCRPAP